MGYSLEDRIVRLVLLSPVLPWLTNAIQPFGLGCIHPDLKAPAPQCGRNRSGQPCGPAEKACEFLKDKFEEVHQFTAGSRRTSSGMATPLEWRMRPSSSANSRPSSSSISGVQSGGLESRCARIPAVICQFMFFVCRPNLLYDRPWRLIPRGNCQQLH